MTTSSFSTTGTGAISGASVSTARASLGRAIPRRPAVTGWLVALLAIGFAAVVTPSLTAERWLGVHLEVGAPAPITVRVAPLTGSDASRGGYIVARGDEVKDVHLRPLQALDDTTPHGAWPTVALFALAAVLAALFCHHVRRSRYGRLVRVQVASLALIAASCIAVKALLLLTAVSILAVPVAVLAIVPTLALDRTVGTATGVLAAVAVSLLIPFDVGVAIVLLVQAVVAGLVAAERPKLRGRTVIVAGAIATACTALVYPLLRYLTTGVLPTAELATPSQSAWVAAAIGPALATVLALPVLPLYQRLVGEITRGTVYQLEDRGHPLLRQIADRAPGTWQHSLAMASMAETAAERIGADARLVRVGAYFHDLGKSLQPKYFIENIEPGETSPHDQLPPEVSCAAIFEHVTEGLATAKRAHLHDRVIDFMHMHHGDGVLEYFWAKCREQGNPNQLTIDSFRYPGHPPQSRETAILAICDAVEAASRTLKKADPAAIDSLVQRIVYGKLHLGQLDESGLSMADLRLIVDSLRETIRHANHGRIEYPWQKEQTAPLAASQGSTTAPRLDAHDRPGQPDAVVVAPDERTHRDSQPPTPALRKSQPVTSDEVYAQTADVRPPGKPAEPVVDDELAIVATAPAPALTGPAALGKGGTLIGKTDAPAAAPPAVDAPKQPRTAPSKPPPQPSGLAAKEVDRSTLLGTGTPVPTAVAEPPKEARTKAATLPPAVRNRAPTVPPLQSIPSANATSPMPVIVPRKQQAQLVDDPGQTEPGLSAMTDDDPGKSAELDRTNPRLVMPLPAPPASSPDLRLPAKPWVAGLAARIDRVLDADDFGGETPVIPPTAAELRALLGTPDVTRRQTIDEVERLQAVANAHDSASDLLAPPPPPRRSHQTTDVTDADIEAAIELVPPARRTAIGVAKKKPGE